MVTKGGENVYLQPMELDVLLLLLKYKYMTVTREHLMTEVWGYDYVRETRVLDIKIFSLRKKLSLGDVIRTLPKLGKL